MKGFEFPEVSKSNEEKNIEIVEEKALDVTENSSDTENNDSFPYSSVEKEEEPSVNSNPYEATIINDNPYQNVNIEDVISTQDNNPMEETKSEPQSILTADQTALSEDEITNIEIARIKAERRVKRKQRRNIFLVVMTFILIILAISYANMDKGNEKIKIEPIDVHFKEKEPEKDLEFSAELNSYYQTRDKANIEKILVDSASDSKKMADINSTVLSQIDKLIDDVINSATDSEDYDNKMNGLSDYIASLNAIKLNDAAILNDTEYNSVKEKINHIKETSTDYFTALNYYNAKDFNNAYYVFSTIPQDNYFSKAAKNNMAKIQDEIIELLKNDISILSTNLDYLDVAEKKAKYFQIKSIIEQYNKAYPHLQLETNQTYNDLYQKYTELSEEGS